MSGTKAGGRKAARRNKENFGEDYYRIIGAQGGEQGTTGGFASSKIGADGLTGRQRAKIVGVKGGHNRHKKSQRIFVKVNQPLN